MLQSPLAAPALLRRRDPEQAAKVGMVELFFDLVFVFAVTQLSHSLLAHLTPGGIAQTSLLLAAVWWVWIYTSWITNWLDPERIPVRLCLFVLMVAGLLLSVSIPQAFGERGLLFAAAYAFMQVGRTLFCLWAMRDASAILQRNFQRILAWAALAAIFWIAGGFAQGEARIRWWLAAFAVEFVAPWLYYRVPGLGRSNVADWDIEGGHLAERCALFVIIALGESILVTGATFTGLEWNGATHTGFIAAVLGTILMWWIYFDTGEERAHHRITHAADPGRQGRSAYTYVHAVIVAGIIGCAVADEVMLVHPDHATGTGLAIMVGGPACYLIGAALFKWLTNDRRAPPLSHVVGLLLLATLAWAGFAYHLPPLTLGVATSVVFAVVATWEAVAIRRPAAPLQTIGN